MAFIKLLFSLLIIYILLRRKYPLGIAMTGGALALAASYPSVFDKIAVIAWQSLFSQGSLTLFGSLYVIMFLEHVLRVNGLLDRLMHASRAVIPDARVVMAMMPAFLGFLPSLGGALFSAPLVNKAAEGINISADRKFLINYWYRHVWEYFLPIYPSLLLAQQILNIPIRKIITKGWIYSLLAMAIGAWLCFSGVSKTGKVQGDEKEAAAAEYYRDIALALGPVVIILLLVVLFKMNIIIATSGVLLSLMMWFGYDFKRFLLGAKHAFHTKTFSLVAGVLVFKETLLQSGAINEVMASITMLSIPVVVMVGVMAFVTAWITGFPQATVGIVFPLIAVLAPGQIGLAVFAMVCTIAGQMVSPMHLCMVVTREYFKCGFSNNIFRVAQGEFLMVAVASVLYYLFH